MGLLFSRLDWLLSFGRAKRPHRILVLGLDCAGKTCSVGSIKCSVAHDHRVPTLGVNHETISFPLGQRTATIEVLDFGGQDRFREQWSPHFEGATGIAFVVDSTDVDRMALASDVLKSVLTHHSLRDVPVVLLTNKQDLPTALSSEDVLNQMGLTYQIQRCREEKGSENGEGGNEMSDFIFLAFGKEQFRHPIRVFSTSAHSEEGILDAFKSITFNSERFIRKARS